jgi:hypothetical protein
MFYIRQGNSETKDRREDSTLQGGQLVPESNKKA